MKQFWPISRNYVVVTGYFVLVILPVVTGLYYSVNVPYLDDYHYILEFLSRFSEANGFLEKTGIFFESRSDFLFLTLNLVLVGIWVVFGKINFILLAGCNILAHLGILWILLRFFEKVRVSILFFLPVLLLFAVPNFAIYTWGAYLGHILALLFSLITLYLFFQDHSKFKFSTIICLILAVFSSPVGLILIPVLLFGLYLTKKTSIRYYWISLFFVICAIYLLIIQKDFSPSFLENKPASLSIYLLNFVVYFGSFFKDLYRDYHIWGGILGLTMGIMIVLSIYFHYQKKIYPHHLLAGMSLAIMIAIMITLMRSGEGLGATTSYRYRLYQSIPIVFLYYLFLTVKEYLSAYWFPTILTCSIMLFVFRFEHNLSALQAHQRQLKFGMLFYQLTENSDQLSYRDTKVAHAILRRAEKNKIYDVSRLNVRPDFYQYQDDFSPKYPLIFNPLKIEKTEKYRIIQGWASTGYFGGHRSEILLQVKNNDQIVQIETGPLLNESFPNSSSASGFSALLDLDWLHYKASNPEVSIIIRHPVRGIIASQMIDFDKN